MQRILVPHDFSDASAASLVYGAALARCSGAALHVLHVGDHTPFEPDLEFPLGLDGMSAATRDRLRMLVPPAEQAALNPHFVVRTGEPAAEIVAYAEEQGIDLIVMGTHGRGFVGQVLMGSVAERVVRTAPCPVLIVRPVAEPRHVVADVVAGAMATA